MNGQATIGRWTEARANAWYAEKGVLIGCNYAPSTAINQLEMWRADSFDPETIDRELGWAENLGFNSIRVFLHDLMWLYDASGLIERMEHFLSIAHRHNIGVMFVLFDGVWDPNPVYHDKRDPKPFVHNSGWLQSPGAEVLSNLPSYESFLKDYVQQVIGHFANDTRIHAWDLFNEPDNLNPTSYVMHEPENKGGLALVLLQKTFEWARAINPSQPLTAGLWYGDWSDESVMKEMDVFMLHHADIITFHNYDAPTEMEQRIQYLKRYNRPVICTEYMARMFGNSFESILPVFKKYDVGGYNWGFVCGRTQTHCPWDSWTSTYNAEPALWFHDIFYKDGTPYRPEEISIICHYTAKGVVTIATR